MGLMWPKGVSHRIALSVDLWMLHVSMMMHDLEIFLYSRKPPCFRLSRTTEMQNLCLTMLCPANIKVSASLFYSLLVNFRICLHLVHRIFLIFFDWVYVYASFLGWLTTPDTPIHTLNYVMHVVSYHTLVLVFSNFLLNIHQYKTFNII